MTAELRHAAGSLLVVGLAGTGLSERERAWLGLVRPAGIILFRRNIADARQTRALLADATASCAPHGLRCVDVEGGAVNRLRDALAPIPSAQAVARRAFNPTLLHPQGRMQKEGARDARSGSALIGEHGELIARAVKAFGFNVTLAPVLDLALPLSATVMGTRAAAPTAAGVVEYAHSFLAGLAAHGVAGCGKHFPGLGGGTLDSHDETPAIRRGFRELWSEDLAPWRELCGQLPMVMVSHAAYPATKGRNRPASVSRFWITGILRKRIGYRGIVFSDDMEMGGILGFMSIEEAAIAAIRAGMDLLEICHSPDLILRAHESLVKEGERSPQFRTLLTARARETAIRRRKLFPDRIPAAFSARRLALLREQMLRFSGMFDESVAHSAPAVTQAGAV